MVRGVLGFVVGAIVWTPAFFLLARLNALVWPAYADHGRVWVDTGIYGFDGPMSVANVTCWVSAEIFAGWVAVAIARRREAAWALAAVLALYLSFLHLYLYWPNFAWWYNVAVAALAAPAVLLGGKLGDGPVRAVDPTDAVAVRAVDRDHARDRVARRRGPDAARRTHDARGSAAARVRARSGGGDG